MQRARDIERRQCQIFRRAMRRVLCRASLLHRLTLRCAVPLACMASLTACTTMLPNTLTTPPPVVDIPMASHEACLPADKADIDFDTSYDGPKVDRKLGYSDLPKMVTDQAMMGSVDRPSYF